jgi:hypothetical protein
LTPLLQPVNGKLNYALADAKTATDKAVDALATALLAAKVTDNKAGASQADIHALSNKHRFSNSSTCVEYLLISRIVVSVAAKTFI